MLLYMYALLAPVRAFTKRFDIMNYSLVEAYRIPIRLDDPSKLYQPIVRFNEDCCTAYPVVQRNGSVSSGFDPEYEDVSSCRKSIGQMYKRSTNFEGFFVTMYAVYLPRCLPTSNLLLNSADIRYLVQRSSQLLSQYLVVAKRHTSEAALSVNGK